MNWCVLKWVWGNVRGVCLIDCLTSLFIFGIWLVVLVGEVRWKESMCFEMAAGIWNRIVQVYCFDHLLVDPKTLIRFRLITYMHWSSNLGSNVLFSNALYFNSRCLNLKSLYSNQSFNLFVDSKILKICVIFCSWLVWSGWHWHTNLDKI